MTRRPLSLAAALLLMLGASVPAGAQETLERTLNLSGGWIGYDGILYTLLPHRFTTTDRPGADVEDFTTYELALGLPWHSLAGVRFAPESPTAPDQPDEWEVYGRTRPLAQMRGAPFDLALTAGFNTAAESLDGELSVARWFGAFRLLGAARAMSDPYGGGEARFALAGGAVLHPNPGGWPIALAGDVGTLLDREAGEEAAWSAAIQVGVTYTPYTLSLFATNTVTSTLEGVSRGVDDVRYGFEFTAPIPVGRFLGWYVPREAAMEAVTGEPDRVERLVRADIVKYLFFPKRIEIPAGTSIEWTNRDEVVHTVSSDNGTWDSGAIEPGQSWRARFDRPGKYTYHCGPHPFMKGIVIVR